jgi:hypothetical protein
MCKKYNLASARLFWGDFRLSNIRGSNNKELFLPCQGHSRKSELTTLLALTKRVQTVAPGLFCLVSQAFQPVPHSGRRPAQRTIVRTMSALRLTIALPQPSLSAFPRSFIVSHWLFLGFPLMQPLPNPAQPGFHCHLHVFSTRILCFLVKFPRKGCF